MISPELFQSVLNTIDSGLLVFDRQGLAQSWNPVLNRLLGLDQHLPGPGYSKDDFRIWLEREMQMAEQDVSHKILHNSGHWVGSEMLARQFSAASKGIPVEFQVQISSGKILQIQSSPVPDGGFSLIINDVTRQARLQHRLDFVQKRHAQTRAIQDRVMATTGRVLQHALQQVIGSVDQLSRQEALAPDADVVRDNMLSSERIVDALNAIMDFVQVGTGKIDLSSDPFDLQSVCHAAAKHLHDQIPPDCLDRFSLDMSGILPVTVRGDAGRVRQLISLLSARMMQYCDDGTMSLKLGMSEEDAGMVMFNFDLHGTGTGLSEENNEIMRNILNGTFRPEEIGQASPADLGLIIARSILRALDAEMTVIANTSQDMKIHFECRMPKVSGQSLSDWQDLPQPGLVLVLDNHTDRGADTALWLGSRGFDIRRFSSVNSLINACQRFIGLATVPMGILVFDEALNQGEETALVEQLSQLWQAQDAAGVAPVLLISSIGLRGENAALTKAGYLGHLNGHPGISTLAFGLRAVQYQARQAEVERIPVNRFVLSENLPAEFHVLVVDDNEVNRDIAKAIMEKEGCMVDLAEDGQDAFDKCRDHFYDLILMDINMPGMDGVTATGHIRTISAHHAGIPVIAVTSNSQTEDAVLYRQSGLNGLVPKPVDAQKLVSMSRALVSMSVRGDTGSMFTDEVMWAKTEKMPIQEDVRSNSSPLSEPANTEGAEAMTSDQDIVNIDLLAGLNNDLGPEILQELISAFLGDIDNHRNNLVAAVDESDLEKLEVAAHTIKGMAGNLGIDKVFHTSQAVVTQCRNGNVADAISETSVLQDQITEAVDFINNLDLASL